jgi:hypothetical protein
LVFNASFILWRVEAFSNAYMPIYMWHYLHSVFLSAV